MTDHRTIHDLFVSIVCDHPLFIDFGVLRFFLDKQTGKRCFMIAAGELRITWGEFVLEGDVGFLIKIHKGD